MRTLERAISFATRALAPFLAASGAACTEEQRPRLPPRPEPVALPARDGPSPILFTDATAESGIDFVHDGGFDGAGWFYVEGIGSGVVAFDADGDEDVDLCFLSGRRLSGPPQEPPPRSRFFRNDGRGRFTDATEESGLGDERYAQGGCVADYDNDGDLDLAVSSIGGPLVLLRNTGARGNWLEVRLQTFAPGAVVTAVLPDGTRLVREVHAGSSYLSSEDPRVHFGLGGATTVKRLLVRYPDGTTAQRIDVASNQIVVVGSATR